MILLTGGGACSGGCMVLGGHGHGGCMVLGVNGPGGAWSGGQGPGGAGGDPLPRRLLLRAVRILLECILVSIFNER